jgi:hypothetical protein
MKILKSILLLLFITSCNNTNEVKKNSTQKKKSIHTEVDSILVPEFQIELKLSEKAEIKINENNETVIVKAMFIGTPKDTTLQDEEYLKFGQLTIGVKEIELSKGRVAKFNNCKISKKDYNSLSNKNFEVNINVFTGRRIFRDNLINCDFLQEGIDSIKNKRFTLKGKLIYGE